MNTMKKMLLSVLLILSALGLTTSLPVFADGMSDVNLYCTGCHNGLIVNGTVIAGGGKSCLNRGYQGWVDTINRMNFKGCGVPAGSIAGMANYLASLEVTSTTTTSSTTTTTAPRIMLTCYITGYGGSCPLGLFAMQIGFFTACVNPGNYQSCPGGTTSISPPTCTNGLPTWDGSAWVCPIDISTTTTTTLNCPAGTYYNSGGWCSTQISTTTTTAPPTTVATTTTTTLKCNTSVNGTTQYKYSGSGTCHDKDHLVNSESWCKKHALHLESNGSHAHAYPHPVCM